MSPVTLVLTRTKVVDNATLGELRVTVSDSVPFATLELWPPIIPAGISPLIYEYSHRFKRKLWELKSVLGHSELKIHTGNTVEDTDGCILVGMRHGIVSGRPAVVSSRIALNALHEALRPFEGQVINIGVCNMD